MKNNRKFLISVFSSLVVLLVLMSKVTLAADDSYDLIEKVFEGNASYSSGTLHYYQNKGTLSTHPCPPKKARIQSVLTYDKRPKPEKVLKRVVSGQDSRKRVQDTTQWPYSIHAHLDMVFNGDLYGGSGVMVGPHHLLTAAHNVYDFEETQTFAQEISVYPALNDAAAPFNKVKVTKAYIFKLWQDRGDSRFDMALLLLERSIGDYTGWGGVLSATDADLHQEEVSITGYPGDKGFNQMWGMSHKIKTFRDETFDYEMDTYGGQSGSAVWVDRFGLPMILGVHTSGLERVINYGSRLSEEKFRKFYGVITDTYTFNDVGSLGFEHLTFIPPVAHRVDGYGPDLGHSPLFAPQAAPKPTSSIPLAAQGHEDIYLRFLNGALIYMDPQTKNKITLPIRDLPNPLESTFDLSRCGDMGKYLSIATGYRKGKKPENKGKVEIWLAPRFLIEKELDSTAAHFKPIMAKWKKEAPVGIFYTLGQWDNMNWYCYLTNKNMDRLSDDHLFTHYVRSHHTKPFTIKACMGTQCQNEMKTFRLEFHL